MKTLKTLFLAILMITGMIVMAEKQPVKFSLTEEAYIDDIPFNTEEIAGTLTNPTDLTLFTLEEEPYIDDIPFNTEAIAQSLQMKADYERAMAEVFPLKAENYINDIPFLTEQLALSAAQVTGSPRTVVLKSSLDPLYTSGKPYIGILEIIIPIIIILGTLSYAVYEYILN